MSDFSPYLQSAKTDTANSRLQLLVLSNGHGEDAIATRILRELQEQPDAPDIYALPIVGEGHAYENLQIPVIGSVRTMPSGGFIYMDGQQFMRDVRGGLLQLTWKQIQAVRRWVQTRKKQSQQCAVLAVGDIVPLLFAWMSGANYAFLGTAKSEYYVRDEVGILKRKSSGAKWENFSGSVYHPWERWLMSRRRCQAVFPRDSLTTQILQKFRIPAYDLGNPMMDNLTPSFASARFYSSNQEQQELARPMVVTILPGSRPPEAYANWKQIMIGISALMAVFNEPDFSGHTSRSIVFLGAIAPGLHLESLIQVLESQGWRATVDTPVSLPDPEVLTFKQKNAYFLLSQNAYNDCLHLGDFAIAMAGTATEQFVGLGKPAITIPGTGPQFTPVFAEAQSRLLGRSVILVNQPQEVGMIARSLFSHPDELHLISENGTQRMGKPGAAKRIAQYMMEKLQ
ncbi:lipid-A-disaccharide synthase-related protein [Calothrix sp. 336/3]|uniref:lipid-A-disaccharide synthase-related protein n=1 Tax=Calothrix sp. 336/3 TaxID=1337936 RepID=UPI0004E2EAF5|nr:lipid-A-disaccharide synthase-related protein [Calothrix sp. 336/3]AKG23363.1 hypothetical protein IJ00_20625 [Calothrix sp. 336/3]